MKNVLNISSVILLFVFTLFVSSPLSAEGNPSSPVFVQEMMGQMEFIQGRLTQLAEEFSSDKYSWRPDEGIRSVGESVLHAAFGNYIFISSTGGEVSDKIGFSMDIPAWDTQSTDKEEIISVLNRSFDDAKAHLSTITEEQLDEEVEIFGMTFTVRNFTVFMISHLHEHLGQLIAYARINGVTPPWSKGDSEG